MTEINWERLRELWAEDEIRRGNATQLSLLTGDQISGSLAGRVSPAEPTSLPEPHKRVERQEGEKGERL